MKKTALISLALAVVTLTVVHTAPAYSWDPTPTLLWALESYNDDHPELQTGEVFLTNERPAEFNFIEWKTKRMGLVAYDRWGGRVDGSIPVFVQQSEITERNMPRNMPEVQKLMKNFTDLP